MMGQTLNVAQQTLDKRPAARNKEGVKSSGEKEQPQKKTVKDRRGVLLPRVMPR